MSDDLNELRRKLDFALFERDEARDTAQMLTRNAVLAEERWKQTFEKRCAREHELIEETVDGFCDALMAKLNEHGVDTTGWNSDDPEETALAHNLCAIADDLTEARAQTTVWAADALNCRQAIRALLKFHPESPETGAELPTEAWTEDYRRAVTYAKRCLLAGGGGGIGNLPAAPESGNIESERLVEHWRKIAEGER